MDSCGRSYEAEVEQNELNLSQVVHTIFTQKHLCDSSDGITSYVLVS